MTREEAKSCIGTIEMLQRLAYNIHGVMDVVDADNCKNIIKALEKEPCEDCISRQEAINCATLNEFRYKIVEDIKTLPSVTPKEKTGWIPVSERLPEERSSVLVYCPRNDNIFLAYLKQGKWYIFSLYCDESIDEPIVAWMPLPEAYKAESEDKEIENESTRS